LAIERRRISWRLTAHYDHTLFFVDMGFIYILEWISRDFVSFYIKLFLVICCSDTVHEVQ